MGIFSRIRRVHHHKPNVKKQPSARHTRFQTLSQKDNCVLSIEHPAEPTEFDVKPVRCPPPEPCIVHDGRLWKERMQSKQTNHFRGGSMPMELQESFEGPFRDVSMLTSYSAPEKTLVTLLLE